MPYIDRNAKNEVRNGRIPKNSGELNFLFTEEIVTYLISNRDPEKGITYSLLADVLSALEGAKLEFYRRVVAPYEDQKMMVNGDVYPVL